MMAVPLLRTLHVAGWRVDTVVDEGFAGLESTYAHHVRHQHLVPVKTWRKRSLLYDVPGRLGLVARIRRERYDALIQVGTGSLGIWLTWAARVPVSIAQDVHHKVAVNRWAYRAVITHRIPVDDHAAAENMAFASALEIAPVTNYPEVRGSASSRTVVIAPDATQSGCAIPLSEVTRIIDGLKAAYRDMTITLIGTKGGIAEQAAIAHGLATDHISCDLRDVVGAVRSAGCVIASESGIGHVAATCGVPVISVFGPSDPDKVRPWGDSERVVVVRNRHPCQPCRANGCQNSGVSDCLKSLPIGDIVQRAMAFLMAPPLSAR